jgi:hypothetical protein
MSMTKIWSQTQMKICELHMTAKKNEYLHMKKTIYLATLLFSILTISSCTNDEDEEKIDILTPTDNAQTEQILQDRAV